MSLVSFVESVQFFEDFGSCLGWYHGFEYAWGVGACNHGFEFGLQGFKVVGAVVPEAAAEAYRFER